MSKIALKLAQAIGIVVLAFIAVGLVVGLVQWVVVAAALVAIPMAGWWLYRRSSGRRASKRSTGPNPRTAGAGASGGRRAEMESRAVLDAAGRCGWCGSATLHRDQYGFPTTPLIHHRREIDAIL